MNLVVDYGNTFAKVGVFEKHSLIREYSFSADVELKQFLQNFSAENFILSSVSKEVSPILDWIQHIKRKFILTSKLPLPIKSLYATPETLGVDRIAGVCGAAEKF